MGFLAGAALAAALAGTASAAARAPGGSLPACVAYAYAAIERHTPAAPRPAACAGLSRAQVSQAASTAIRMTLTSGTKAARRRQAVAAARWTRAMITAPAPAVASPGPAAGPAVETRSGGRGLGGVSELAAEAGALLAWLATAASGGWILIRWLLAGGSLRRRSAVAAPSALILGHIGGGVLGLLLWSVFLATGWIALAWISLGLLAPVAGLGMSVLLLGLPRPARAPLGGRRAAGFPALAVAAHGLCVVVVLLLVLMATVGAG